MATIIMSSANSAESIQIVKNISNEFRIRNVGLIFLLLMIYISFGFKLEGNLSTVDFSRVDVVLRLKYPPEQVSMISMMMSL